ncbi:hypothetical protein EYC84_005026 [Monilinia fructicola]|uniref:tRNA-intron lyase n=1 Tax=Monilinia fructicola TaxID=38448 RepID=A0A5M9JW71_MONFR|nr:hypothetical protein EYC84_005026 [Monilinia fructicola]
MLIGYRYLVAAPCCPGVSTVGEEFGCFGIAMTSHSRSIRGLWEQGFYGKGSLSRSEPSWLTREKKRRGVSKATASEDITRKRRADRQQTKWERARKEREAIDQTLLAEAKANELPNTNFIVATEENIAISSSSSIAAVGVTLSSTELITAPTGPMQLLALPNSSTAIVKTEVIEEPSSQNVVDADEVASSGVASFIAPTGPLTILSLPNSLAELESRTQSLTNSQAPSTVISSLAEATISSNVYSAPVGPLELLALPNSSTVTTTANDALNIGVEKSNVVLDGYITPPTSVELDISLVPTPGSLEVVTPERVLAVKEHEINDKTHVAEHIDNATYAPITPISTKEAQNTGSDGDIPEYSPSSVVDRQKSVRFSPTVEQTTFLPSQPPSPGRIVASTEEKPDAPLEVTLDEEMVIEDQEHFQLTMEEAFFLSYGLGALTVLDPVTKSPISNQDLFSLFRKTSYFPPALNPSLSTDDPFLVNYVVYHHFRSLGWVVRGGTKFSVDYLLYNRGPVFSHAEFAVLILPSYSDPYWSSGPFLQNYVRGKQERSWSWMHCINRVITQVKKTLILVYVDIPAPVDGSNKENSVDELLQKYKVREVVLKRWSPNRSRD